MTCIADPDCSLLAAFLATEYRVVVRDRSFVIRIGERHPGLDRALGQRAWFLISAYNPDARQLDPARNLGRHGALVEATCEAGLDHWSGTHHSADGSWPVEASLLILDAAIDWVHAQAHALGQVAILAGRAMQPARLWVYNSDRLPDEHADVVRIGQ